MFFKKFRKSLNNFFRDIKDVNDNLHYIETGLGNLGEIEDTLDETVVSNKRYHNLLVQCGGFYTTSDKALFVEGAFPSDTLVHRIKVLAEFDPNHTTYHYSEIDQFISLKDKNGDVIDMGEIGRSKSVWLNIITTSISYLSSDMLHSMGIDITHSSPGRIQAEITLTLGYDFEGRTVGVTKELIESIEKCGWVVSSGRDTYEFEPVNETALPEETASVGDTPEPIVEGANEEAPEDQQEVPLLPLEELEEALDQVRGLTGDDYKTALQAANKAALDFAILANKKLKTL